MTPQVPTPTTPDPRNRPNPHVFSQPNLSIFGKLRSGDPCICGDFARTDQKCAENRHFLHISLILFGTEAGFRHGGAVLTVFTDF